MNMLPQILCCWHKKSIFVLMSTISIHDVVSVLKSSVADDLCNYRLKARYISGNNKGGIYVKNQVRWFHSESYQRRRSSAYHIEIKSAFEKDSLMLFDVIEQRPFYVRRWAIIEFENKKSDSFMSTSVELVNVGNNAAMLIDRSYYSDNYSPEVSYHNVRFTNGSGAVIARWGIDNRFPKTVLSILAKDPHALQVLRKKVQFLLGGGVIPYKKRNGEDVIVEDLQVKNFLKANHSLLEKVLVAAATNLEYFDSFAVEFFLNRAKNKVVAFRNIDATNYRLIKAKDGDEEPSEIMLQRQSNQAADIRPLFNWSKAKEFSEFVLYQKYHEPGNPYYSTPPWWGAKSELDLRNLILEMMIQSMTNGWSLKYQVEVHESFYADCDSDEIKKREKKQKLVSELNRVLSAKENYNNNLVTEMISDQQGKPYSGVKINVINQSLIDTSVTKLIELKQNANPASFGLDIGLAGLNVAKNLSSGSEIRNKFIMHLALNTPVPRKMLLKILTVIKLIEGWDSEIEFMFKDIEITKLDIEKEAKREVIIQ